MSSGTLRRLQNVTPDLRTLIDGFDSTWRSIASACSDLTPEQWETPTALPGWSVKDNVSHIVAEEAYMLGDPSPVHELPAGLTHLRSDFAKEIEIPIDYRRRLPGHEVLAELESIAARRLVVLRGYDEAALDDQVPFAGGTTTLRNALGIRLFDCWIHGQDIRRALDRPGDLDTVAAHLTLQRLLAALTQLADDVPAAAGTTLVIETTGPLPSVSSLLLGSEPTCTDGGTGDATVHISCRFETFVELATGRATHAQRTSDVAISGDVPLGAELLRHFAVTP